MGKHPRKGSPFASRADTGGHDRACAEFGAVDEVFEEAWGFTAQPTCPIADRRMRCASAGPPMSMRFAMRLLIGPGAPLAAIGMRVFWAARIRLKQTANTHQPTEERTVTVQIS